MLLWLQMYNESIEQAINNAEARLDAQNHLLADTFKIDARLEAEILLAHTLEKQRSYIRAYPETRLSQTQSTTLETILQRRLQGEPIAYITGHREFWSLDLITTEHTLIPRPETELLVELTLKNIPASDKMLIADLGTGSGAIALSIARERPQCTIIATDVSAATLEIAKQNADNLQLNNIQFFCGDWFNALPQKKYDIIVSNPPYIPTNDDHLKQGDIRFEPEIALSSGVDGLNAIRTILKTAPQYLVDDGLLLLEHGYDQRDKISCIVKENTYHDTTFHKDLNEQDRIITARKNSN